MVSIQQLRGQNFAIFWPPPLRGQFLYPERGQKQTFIDPLPSHFIHVVIEWPLVQLSCLNAISIHYGQVGYWGSNLEYQKWFCYTKKMNGLQGNLIILGPYPHAMSTPKIMRFLV